VNVLRTKLVFLVFVVCLLAMALGAFDPVSWWDGE
jgi:hypothetical protein